MMRILLLLASHSLVGVAGFAAGIYLLPILTAPPAASGEVVAAAAASASYRGEFRRDLAGSDFLHWGEGAVSVGPDVIALHGRVAPGPDYRLYLSPAFVEDEASFQALHDRMLQVGAVRSFENFIVELPPGTDLAAYDTVVVWCEAFGEFITAARYR